MQYFDTLNFFQLKNAFDNLFEGLMESKDGEKEAAEVYVTSLVHYFVGLLSLPIFLLTLY